jgi:hypothetical protein
VAITNNSGLAGVAYWIHTHFKGKGADIRKDNPGIQQVYSWISSQYRDGRITSISDEEMLEQVRRYLPELL